MKNKDVFIGIGCLEGVFSLQVKEGSKANQAPLKHVEYELKTFKEKLEQTKNSKSSHN